MRPYDAIKEREYMKKTGELDRRKREEEEDQRIADRRQRDAMGEDSPSPYRSY